MKFAMEIAGSPGQSLSDAGARAIAASVDLQAKAIANAYADAMRELGDQDKKRLRDDLAAGGFYRAERLAKTWRANVYPKAGGSFDPALQLVNRAGDIIETFSSGATITAHAATYLAIPLEPAKAILRRQNQAKNRTRTWGGQFDKEDTSIKRVERVLGARLTPVLNHTTGKGVLVAPGTFGNSGRRLKRQGRPTAFFALVRQATLKKRIRGLALVEEIRVGFAESFDRALSPRLGAIGQDGGQ